MHPDCFLHHVFQRQKKMDLLLSKMWQEGIWSRDGMIYCFQRGICNAETTLSEDRDFSLEWTVKSLSHQHCLLTFGFLLNLARESSARSSVLSFILHSHAAPVLNRPVRWRDHRHEDMSPTISLRMNNTPLIPCVIKTLCLFFLCHLTTSAWSFSHELLCTNATEKTL